MNPDRGQDDSFLVRPSSKEGDFVLSFRNHGGVFHTRIRNCRGVYKISEQDSFSTLYELVKAYIETDIERRTTDGGTMYMNLKYPVESEHPTRERWFHGQISKQEAEIRLKDNGQYGSYLVRDSQSEPGGFVMSVRGYHEDTFHHVKIGYKERRYYIDEIQFDSLPAVVRELTKGAVASCLGVNAKLPLLLTPDKDSLMQASGDTFRFTIVKGDLAEQGTEVIVNSTTLHLDLSSGTVSRQLLKAGGVDIQEECKRRYPNGIKFGDIAETRGGNLACRNIYHVSLLKWTSNPLVEQSLRDVILQCLTKASDSGRRSIAFPVLGTGTLNYPRDTVAQCVFESFDSFSSNHPETSLTEARIVVHPSDVENLKIFEDVGAARATPETSNKFSAAELASHHLPTNWSRMAAQEFVCKIQLSPIDGEYKRVSQAFIAGVGSQYTIVKIERIQNRTLHIQYTMHKHRMTTQNPGMKIERYLWHGTSYDAISSINIHGFSRSYTGKNATVYGEGSYFAVCPSYSAQDIYSPPTKNGHRHMYQAAVLTGHYTRGYSGMRHPPPKDTATPHIKYDSVVNNMDNPTIFVVFHDVQAYPQYLVTFM